MRNPIFLIRSRALTEIQPEPEPEPELQCSAPVAHPAIGLGLDVSALTGRPRQCRDLCIGTTPLQRSLHWHRTSMQLTSNLCIGILCRCRDLGSGVVPFPKISASTANAKAEIRR